MINEIQEHIAQLAKKIGERVNFELTIGADSPSEPCCALSTYMQIRTNTYKTIYCTTLKQVLDTTVDEFVK